LLEEHFLASEIAPDPFCIGAPWGANFKFDQNVYNVKTDTRLKVKAKGDSVTNDREAIQQAVDKASAEGGGVVYFPEGKYKLAFTSGSGLTMRSNVVLKGDGPGLSGIQYGYGTPPPYPDPIGKGSWPDNTVDGVGLLWPLETTRSGLSGLCIKNVNTSGIWRHSLKTMLPKVKTPGSAGSEFFAVNWLSKPVLTVDKESSLARDALKLACTSLFSAVTVAICVSFCVMVLPSSFFA